MAFICIIIIIAIVSHHVDDPNDADNCVKILLLLLLFSIYVYVIYIYKYIPIYIYVYIYQQFINNAIICV